MDWLEVRLRRYKCMVNYWNRLVDMDDSRLTKRVLNMIVRGTGVTGHVI
jgi:hypothetical protein